MSRLLLVRHGETKLNSRERFWGKTDVELGETGIRQAEQLRDRLAMERIDTIYTSQMRRSRTTAEIIASRHRLEVITCPELNEVNFGEFEGLTFAEISQRYPEVAAQWTEWDTALRFPAGESIGELNERVGRFLPWLEKHATEEGVLIVSHSGPLRLLICHLLGIDLCHWRQLRLDLASLSIMDTYPQGAIITLLNDISHLR